MVKTEGLYTLINDISAALVYVAVFVFILLRRQLSCAPCRIGYEKTETLRAKNAFCKGVFSRVSWLILTSGVYVGVYLLYGLTPSFSFLSNNEFFTINNYFIVLYFGWIIVLAAFLVLGVDFREGMDCLTPFFAVEMGLGKIACFCAGCCYGIPWRGGMFNYSTSKTEFPVQLLECFVGLLLAGVLFYCYYKRKSAGKLYPLYMILYSATRFFTEFLRGDHKANWIGMKPYQLLCLIGIVIGAVWLVVIHVLEKRNKRFLYGTNLIDFIVEKRSKK